MFSEEIYEANYRGYNTDLITETTVYIPETNIHICEEEF